MIEIFINDDKLEKEDIDGTEVRVKAFLRNKNNEVMIIHNNYTYQLPGGHNINDETLNESLIREVKEETGIEVDVNYEPFMKIKEYNYNFMNTGKNICNIIYYYDIKTDENPKYDNLNLTELEKKTDLKHYYVKLDYLEKFIEEGRIKKLVNDIIANELLLVTKEYIKHIEREF